MITENTYGIIIQARDGSSRLENKMSRPFYDHFSLLEIILIILIDQFKDMPIVLATTTSKVDDALEEIGLKYQLPVFRGSEQNVLKRMINAAKVNNIDVIVRVCADNPFLDIESITNLITQHKKTPEIEYVSYEVGKDRPAILSHFGFYTELARLEALEKIFTKTEDPIYLEHVTNYIYTHPDEYRLHFIHAPSYVYNRKDLRLTVDTIQDFKLTQRLYASKIKNNWNHQELINFIDANSEIKKSMVQMIQSNTK